MYVDPELNCAIDHRRECRTAAVGCTACPPMEDRLMIWPEPCLCMTGNAAAIPCRKPRMFTSIVRFHSSILSSSSFESGITADAINMTSTRPKCSTANLVKAWHIFKVGDIQSVEFSAAPHRFELLRSAFSTGRCVAPRERRVPPLRASSRASATPMPLLAPVIRIVLF